MLYTQINNNNSPSFSNVPLKFLKSKWLIITICLLYVVLIRIPENNKLQIIDSDKSTPEHVPNIPSRKQILIVTEYRSGSTFIAETFNKNHDASYLFEPLLLTNFVNESGYNYLDFNSTQKLIREYFVNCTIPDPSLYITSKNYNENPKHMEVVLRYCKQNNICFRNKHDGFKKLISPLNSPPVDNNHFNSWPPVDIELASEYCLKSQATTAKVIRLQGVPANMSQNSIVFSYFCDILAGTPCRQVERFERYCSAVCPRFTDNLLC